MTTTANVFSTPDNTIGQLNGFFKDTWAAKLGELIPDGVKIQNKIKFMSKDKMPGNLFHQPVVLGMEHGVTFGSPDSDAFSLNPAISGAIKDAQVRGNPLVLRSVLGYNAASRAAQGTQAAFMDASKWLVGNMLRSVTKKLEIEMFYGQSGYGTVASVSGAVVTIATAEWAPGIWGGAEGMPIEIYRGATKVFESSVVSVDFENRTITLVNDASTLQAADVIYHKGAYGNEFAGIKKILTNTGTLFNIDASVYNLWKGSTFGASSGPLSFAKLSIAAAKAVEKGQDGTLVALINPRAFANMMTDQAALRKYDTSYSSSKMENGSKSITFYSQNGNIEIEPSIYVKEGDAFLLSIEEWVRVGSSDVTFKRPGMGTEFFRELNDAAGYELRLWTDQAIFCQAPGRNVYINGIVNNATGTP